MVTQVARSSDKAIADYTPQEWQSYLGRLQLTNQRLGEIDSFSGSSGFGSSGAMGGRPAGSGSGSSSSSSGGLFGSLDGSLSGYMDQAKDLARFRLGLDQEQANFSYGLRNREADEDLRRTTALRGTDFGYNYKLAEQQIGGQKDLMNIQQGATTDRLQRQLESQQTMQQRGFDQQNLFRAQSAALALRGLR